MYNNKVSVLHVHTCMCSSLFPECKHMYMYIAPNLVKRSLGKTQGRTEVESEKGTSVLLFLSILCHIFFT